jgi:dTDP-4-amino-4,6-dideoxygalactose transaminase
VGYRVPFVDPRTHFQSYRSEIEGAIVDCLCHGDLIYRRQLKAFENHFATFVGTKYAVGVNSCYHALHFSLVASGIGPGDEVITVAHTFVATVSAIVNAGAKPVLIDVGEDYNLNPGRLEAAITPRTKAILPVHLNGRVADMDRIQRVADEHGLFIIEDAAQAIGGTLDERKAGSFGIAGCFSFYPFKLLGGFGDGGAVTTNDARIARIISLLRYNGEDRETGEFHYHGQTALLDNVQAAVLDVKLGHVPDWIRHRRSIAALYRQRLEGVGDLRLPHFNERRHFDVFQNYVVRTKQRDRLREHLERHGIETLVSWPKPMWEHPGLGLENPHLPETESICREVISLPISAEATLEQVDMVAQAIRSFYGGVRMADADRQAVIETRDLGHPALSARTARIVQSEIRAMTIECEKRKGINLAQGVCNMEVPEPVRRAAQSAIKQGINSYTRYDGLAELRRVIARKLKEFNGLMADPDTEIIVSGGSTGAMYSASLALLNPGDEVILFEPFYGYHLSTLLAVDAVPAFVRLHPPEWTFDRDDLRRVVTPRTRAIVVGTPANPSGKVFAREELQWIAELATEHNLIVFTDEIYEHFVYDGHSHFSPAVLPELRERTVTISGFSKLLSITGWRIGYSVCNARWAEAIGYINDLIYVCAPAPLQMGVARGVEALSPDYYRLLCAEYLQKRNWLCSALDASGLPAYTPRGAYYVLANVSRLPGKGSKEKAMFLLEKAGVASVPGEAFYREVGGSDLLRFCFAKSNSELQEACRRLEGLC